MGGGYLIGDISIPSTQTYAEASFGKGVFSMAAVTSSTRDYKLKFKNVLGGLKLQLKGTAVITSISITGNNKEKLCGSAQVTVSSTAAPAITLTDAKANAVILYCGDGVRLNSNTATAFIIALPPMTMTDGFTVTVTDSQGQQMEIKTTKSQSITRSNLLTMPAITFEGTIGNDNCRAWVDLGLPSGLKWGSMNIGATSKTDEGSKYAWGEITTKTSYLSTNYKYGNWGPSISSDMTKYNAKDGLTILARADDVASEIMESKWRMPSQGEWNELINNCDWTDVWHPGGYSILLYYRGVSKNNGEEIILPEGSYWSRENCHYSNRYDEAYYVGIWGDDEYDSRIGFGAGLRCWGFLIRPVYDQSLIQEIDEE